MKWIVLAVLLFSILFVHFRGRVRLPLLRQFADHSSIMAPINLFIYLFSRVPAKPFPLVEQYQAMRLLDDNWQLIRDEALALQQQARIKAAERNNDAGFNSFFKAGWKRFYLKWYEASHPSAQAHCPQTVALLQRIPFIKAAMFAELGPQGTLNPHRDPYAGSLRYHLGLVTPNDDRCFIEVDGQRHSWRDGQSVIFDETFIHWAQNGTEHSRLILFCDLERPLRFAWAEAVNRWLGRTLMTAAASPNQDGDQEGRISKLFRFVWAGGQCRRRFKAWNKTAYRSTKVLLIVALGAAVVMV
ncbi:aspartyl/asparaginyl beta-hydroxylase domain-containing protein [Pseudomonas turukhanskensis]|uniref:Dioxygenase n=1 Tax=Pseudomonas turukhanskensis TaxID=1806536 RepID=A0A9W6NEN7_9PSED|nr:aspartyl/asparaginyl beta-hydroxylase domain-containing protein [Pseudomonas turukhanskensis]GLK88168.1 dioxygenase [Pseudomonas turukhanskensis]